MTLLSLLHVTWNHVHGFTRVGSQLCRTLFGSSKLVLKLCKASPVPKRKPKKNWSPSCKDWIFEEIEYAHTEISQLPYETREHTNKQLNPYKREAIGIHYTAINSKTNKNPHCLLMYDQKPKSSIWRIKKFHLGKNIYLTKKKTKSKLPIQVINGTPNNQQPYHQNSSVFVPTTSFTKENQHKQK